MVKYGFHYLTDAPQKIIDSYKRREKKTIENLKFEAGIIKTLGIDSQVRAPNSMALSDLEKIIIHYKDRVLSIYPVDIVGSVKGLWSNFDTRPKSAAQESGSLLAMQENDDIALELWHKGKLLATSYENNSDDFSSLLGTYFPQAKTAVDTMKNPKKSSVLNFPLFLPDDWEYRWKITQISEHIFMAEDKI